MSLLTHKEVLLAKTEATYYVDPTPTVAANAILVEDLSWSLAGARSIERNPVRSSLGALKSLYGGTLVSISFTTEVKGSGAAGTAPEIDPLLEGCGFLGTNSPGVSETYEPTSSSTPNKSVAFYYYADATLFKVLGSYGDFTFTMETGSVAKINWTFTGHATTMTDVTPGTAVYDNTVPPVMIAVTGFTVGGYPAIINALTFTPANTVTTPASLIAADGFGTIRISKRDVQGSFDPEHVTVATSNFWQDFRSATSKVLTTGVIGATAGNRFKIDMPAMYYRSVAPGDRDGIRTWDIPFGAAESSGDDEVTITFT